MKALRENIQENLKKGFIRKSNSPAGAPVLFVKKHNGATIMCRLSPLQCYNHQE